MTILIATNGSEASGRAVERAADLFDPSEVVVATVVPGERVTSDAGDGRTALRAATDRAAVDEATRVLARARETLGPAVRVVLLDGDPVEALCGIAVAESAEAIVVGSLGPGPVQAVVHGSIAPDLVRSAPCTVIDLGAPPRRRPDWGRIPSMGTGADDDIEARIRYLALAQHKLKTPLAVVAGWSDALQKWELLDPEERSGGLAAIKRAADELRAQMDDLIEEARAHLLAGSLAMQTVDLGSFVDDLVDSFWFDPDRHELVSSIGPGVQVSADPEALRRILDHLVTNAITYSPDGGRIDIGADAGAEQVVLRVVDEGVGIGDDVDILFEPFRRGDGAAGIARGTGLGLHVARSLARAMGGDLVASPGADAGAVFEVVLRAA